MSRSTDSDSAREALVAAVAAVGADTEPGDVDHHLALIETVVELEGQARHMLRDAVASARSAGATWSAIGATMGMTRQAAQQRFPDPTPPSSSDLDPDERVLGPVTSANEMEELAIAGRLGWHSVDCGPWHHRVVRSDTQWEHRRVSMLRRSATALEDEGWELIRSSFPYTYLKRNLGIPALPEP